MKPRRKKFAPAVYRAILIRQRNRCACGCREKFTDITDVHFDHEVPLHLDGPDTPENLRALKKRHHIKKSVAEAKARAKVKRIQATAGLTKPKLSARQKAMSKFFGFEEAKT